MPFHILTYHWFQLLSLAAAIICYRGLTRFSLVPFIPLLLVTCIIELMGSNMKFFGWTSNYFIYNMYLLLTPPLYLLLFHSMLRMNQKVKPIFTIIAALCILVILLNYFFVQGTDKFNSFSFLFIEIMNIVFCCLVLFRMALVATPAKENIYTHPYFWISLSLLLFSLGAVMVLGMQEYIARNNIQLDGKNIYRTIMPLLNILLYLGYAYAFYLCRKKKNSSPS